MGYHKRQITKGSYGEVSKILEEAFELLDAEEQGVKIMQLLELSDLYGAIEAYLKKHHPNSTMDDLRSMSERTSEAFTSGERHA